MKNRFLCAFVLLLLPLPAFSSAQTDSKKDPYAAIPMNKNKSYGSFSAILVLPKTPIVDKYRERAYSNWAPTKKIEGLDRCVIAAEVANNGTLYNLKIESSSKDMQLDADCIQAVMGASGSYNMGIPEGTLSKVLFAFDSKIKAAHPDGISPFKAQNPAIKGDYIAFYRIPLDILNRYPGLFTEAELLSDDNIGLIEAVKGVDGNLELPDYSVDRIREIYQGIWIPFFISHNSPTKQQVLEIRKNLSFDERSNIEGKTKKK